MTDTEHHRQSKEFVYPNCGNRGQAEIGKSAPGNASAARIVSVSSGFAVKAVGKDGQRSAITCENCRTNTMSL